MLQKVFWQVCLDRMLCKDHHCLNFGLYTLVISVFVAVLTYAATGESAGRREMPGLFFLPLLQEKWLTLRPPTALAVAGGGKTVS